MTITLQELIDQSRQRADMENSQFVTDSELTNYINSSIAELHDLMISAYDSDYSIASVTFSTSANTADYQLPNGTLYSAAPAFYKLRGVDVALNGTDYFSLQPFNFNERNRNSQLNWSVVDGPNLRYRLVGSNLTFNPAPNGSYNCKLWYIPVATKLVSLSDTLDDLNQYAEFVIVDAAIKMMQKEESDVTILGIQKASMIQRIQDMAQNRDAGSGDSVSDIYAENSLYYFNKA